MDVIIKMKIRILFFIVFLPFVLLAQTNGIISDAVIIPPDYDTFVPPPEIGGSYVDPAFGTKVFRMTNSTRFNDNVIGGYFSNSEICYFNKDGSYFIASENDIVNGDTVQVTFLYNGITGARLKLLGGGSIRPYWIRWALADKYKKNGTYISFDPLYHFYKYEGNEVRLYDVRDMENYVVLHKFNEYNEIGPAGGEGDISDDGRYWVLDGDEKEMFAYDLIDDIKYPVSTFDVGSMGSKGSDVGIDYACISPRGNYIVVAWGTDPGVGRYRGIEVYDKNWNFQRQIYPGIIHWEVGVDAFGEEVVYTAGTKRYPEFAELDGINTGDFISIRLRDGKIRLLKRVDIWSPFSISACNSVNDHRYVYISLSGRRSDDPEELWAPFWGEIIEVPTDGSGEVRRLLHHRSRPIEGKSEKFFQPDAVVNRQGTKIVFRSTYNTHYADLFMFDVGSRDESYSDTTPPNPPVNLNGSAKSPTSIELTWNQPEAASDGDLPAFYRVYRNGEEIAESFETKYLDTGLEESADYQYKVYSVDKAGLASTSSASGIFATLGDTTPPQLESVEVTRSTGLLVRFSEAVDENTAEDPANYSLNHNGTIYSCSLSADSVTVELSTSPIILGVEYTLTVQNVRDLSANGNVIESGALKNFELYADFYDDFEDDDLQNWQFLNSSRWELVPDDDDHALYLNTSEYDSPGGKRLGEIALIDKTVFLAKQFKMNCMAKSAEDVISNKQADYALVFGYADSLNYYYVQFHAYDISVNRIVDGERTDQQKYTFDISLDQYHKLGLQFQNDSLSVYMDDNKLFSQYLPAAVSGQVGVGSYNDAAFFDNVNLQGNALGDNVPPATPSGLKISTNG